MTKLAKIPLTCPHCGREQLVSKAALSTVCNACARHIVLEDLGKSIPNAWTKAKAAKAAEPTRKIQCFDCGTELEVPQCAQSTMCRQCSRYIDLLDYDISHAVSKNFQTKGRFVIQPNGYVFNTEAIVGDAVIKGRLIGRLAAERTLTIYSTAQIKGTFTAGQLLIPAGNFFQCEDRINVVSAEIEGELNADVSVDQEMVVKSTGRLFGHLEAGSVLVDSGGVFVGEARIRPKVR